MTRKRNTPTEYPCMFSTSFLREDIDPRIKKRWPKAPFGNLRRIWREQHCKTLNPYGSASCPYRSEDCAVAFLQAVELSLSNGEKPVAYFYRAAKTSALNRADHKPLARQTEERLRHARHVAVGRVERHEDGGGIISFTLSDELRRIISRPSPLRTVLGSFDFRPRQGSSEDGEESTK